MKKQYIAPTAEAIVLHAESMLAASAPTITINPDQTGEAGNSYSNRHGGWNSDDWSRRDDD